MTASPLWPAFSRLSHPHYPGTELVFTRGEGASLFDRSGRRYFDAFSTLWTNLVGHGREEIIEAMAEQSRKLSFMHLFSGSLHEPGLALSQRLVETSPFGHSKAFFGLSGSDATETAIKLARAYWSLQGRPEKNIVVGRMSEYHGTSLGALSLMGSDSYQKPYAPLVPATHRVPAPNCFHCPYGKRPESCATECRGAFDAYFEQVNARERVAAILIEPAITSDGLIPPPKGYWEHVQRLCRENDVLVIADEVSTGMGRAGTLYASTQYGLVPDIAYLAKSLTSGYAPLSAVTTSQRVYDALNSGGSYFTHGSTFAGHPVSCVAALQVLEILFRDGLIERARELGERMRSGLSVKVLPLPAVGSVRGLGTLFEIELVGDKARRTPPKDEVATGMRIYRKLLDRGQYVRALGRYLCLAPPLISTDEQIGELIDALADTLREEETNTA